ncbi:MAG: hypothetical protein H7Y27_08650 [Gemmatimonadaceae bacterium]|nr:hypothetical protein [Chitinophagaceae bacterium]
MKNISADTSLAQCSYYFKFYFTEALRYAGLADQFTATLGPWNDMLARGLTTFAEEADPVRSDCHAWSASPVYYFLSLICGITPQSPGFETVRIEPHPGELKWIKGSFPHRAGNIEFSYSRDTKGKFSAKIVMPEKLTGVFVWNGTEYNLVPGIYSFTEK